MSHILPPTVRLAWITVLIGTANARSADQHVEFFEARIRPVLIEHCYQCHNSADTAEGSLALDSRAALLKGGDGGAIIVPGNPKKSRLLSILRHDVEGLEMPEGGPKLDARVVADFERWIAEGAVDPREHPPSSDELAAATSWDAVLKRRKQWWSFQPIQPASPPAVDDPLWADHPIDCFTESARKSKGLKAGKQADAATLVRRVFFNLTGLPPDAEQSQMWISRLAAARPSGHRNVVSQLVDELLASPRFGERWARHWMDWIRYADSHGSEGDPQIAEAWVYRDYLIRALNADVPVDQLIKEHVAGDLLPNPRINDQQGISESAIGPAHWRMVFHGFAPTDALDERVRFTDDQINAFSKAFLGLTVSCARCHDHKFDAISQKDYYALFGILASCRPGRTVINLPDRLNFNREALTELKQKIRQAVADDWLNSVSTTKTRISRDDGLWKQAEKPDSVLNPVFVIRQQLKKGGVFANAWHKVRDAYQQKRERWTRQQSGNYLQHWDLARQQDYEQWFATGVGLPAMPQSSGEFSIAPEGDNALTGIYPSGVYSHALSQKHPARLTSADFSIGENHELWILAAGDSEASVRYVVQDYPRNGTVYPVPKLSPGWKWQKFDLSYWSGDDIHIELTTAKDAPLLVGNRPRSWFGVRQALLASKGQFTPVDSVEFLAPVFDGEEQTPPQSLDDLATLYTDAVTAAVHAWKNRSATDAQAMLLDACLKQGILPGRLSQLPSAQQLIVRYRQLEEAIPIPTRVPGLEEAHVRNYPLFERGNHKLPGEEVPRRFLEAIDPKPYGSESSGRRELAEDLVRDDNPLTRRVIVNRVWHHLFGRGIVSTPDNFGRLGSKPSHPQLLDWLADRFAKEGWSLRTLIRTIVTSRTWQLSSAASADSQRTDPDNLLLTHANVRRMEAEAVRDQLLTVSGQIQHQLSGAPVSGASPRRSVYVRVQRNSLDPFLRTFDFPEPFTAVGRRDVTNVPAQSLTMMNDARVSAWATAWARRIMSSEQSVTTEQRIQEMFRTAFVRPASNDEVEYCRQYLSSTSERIRKQKNRLKLLQQQVAEARQQIDRLKAPVRKRLMEELSAGRETSDSDLPEPIARWEFSESLGDLSGTADGKLKSGANLVDGGLAVKDGGYVVTWPLRQDLSAKTLEAWVQLDNLQQRGGGVITVQTPDGVFFDAIVFGERKSQQWMAGSNGFVRTADFDGPQESEALNQPVHLAISYHEDGRITGYRNGQPYGKSYQSNGPYRFRSGQTVVGFGVRHLPAGGNRLLAGRILKAAVYDRALSAEEVAAAFDGSAVFVSEKRVLASLTEQDRAVIEQADRRIAALETQISELGNVPDSDSDVVLWAELARAFFTFKEFIYVR